MDEYELISVSRDLLNQSIFIFLLVAVVVEVLLVVALMAWVVAADAELFLFHMYIFIKEIMVVKFLPSFEC